MWLVSLKNDPFILSVYSNAKAIESQIPLPFCVRPCCLSKLFSLKKVAVPLLYQGSPIKLHLYQGSIPWMFLESKCFPPVARGTKTCAVLEVIVQVCICLCLWLQRYFESRKREQKKRVHGSTR